MIVEHAHKWGGSTWDETILPETVTTKLGLKPGSSVDRLCVVPGCDAALIGDPDPTVLNEDVIVKRNLLPSKIIKNFGHI